MSDVCPDLAKLVPEAMRLIFGPTALTTNWGMGRDPVLVGNGAWVTLEVTVIVDPSTPQEWTRGMCHYDHWGPRPWEKTNA